MYGDAYFPKHLVDECKAILLELCWKIETEKPKNIDELYKLSHASTEKLNDLESEFSTSDSEMETVARDCLGIDMIFIAEAYGFKADAEELIAPRNW